MNQNQNNQNNQNNLYYIGFCYLWVCINIGINIYCNQQVNQYFDYKIGKGDNLILAEMWLERAQWAFWAGLFCLIIGNIICLSRKWARWEKILFQICMIGFYCLNILILNMIFS